MQEKNLLKNKLKKIFKDRVFVSLAIGGLFLNVVIFIIIKLFINFDQSAFILHYNVFFGIDKITFNFNENPIELLLVPIGGLFIWFINFIMAVLLFLTSLREQLQYVDVNNGLDKTKKSCGKILKEKLYPKIFGSYLLLASALAIEAVIGIYILSIILVNN
ncbi:MAG: hypothetical protein PF549_00465 [Patescibacteria group bacterium]|jgi:hypothetical protein|nr:hypothetical protein [Patescibacteria group bacterium]